MSINKRLISTGAGAITCTTDSTDPFGDSSGVALYSLDYDASTAPDGTDFSGSPTNVEFGVGGKINYGARFNGSSSYIESGISTDILNSDYTISFWGKSSNSSGGQTFINTNSGAVAFVRIDFSADGNLLFYHRNSASTTYVDTSIVSGMADGNWHHVVITKDNTSVKAYKDGSLVGTITSTSGTYSNSTTLQIGRNNYNTSGSNNFDGDIDQVRIFNKALDETTNGEISALYAETACVYECTTDDVNYPFSDGTNVEAYYKLDNSSEDYVGGNDGSDTNVEYRFGRYGQAAVFNGSSSYIDTGISTLTSAGGSVSLWVKTTDTTASFFGTNSNSDTNRFYFGVRDSKFWIGAGNSQVFTVSASNLIDGNWHNVALTLDGSTAKYYLDGASTPVASLSYSGGGVCNVNPVIGGLRTSGGVNSSYYTNGSIDQVRIYSTALTSSQVTELYEEKPCADTSNFKTVLYTGNGGTQYISNVGFEPDMVWAKARSNTHPHVVFDIVRGENKQISPDETSAEVTRTSGAYEFETNGFTVSTAGNSNNNNYTYVAWCWKGGGDDVLNEVGDIDSQVSANTEAGFSIVKYTGNATAGATVGHGLDNPPDLIFIKNIDKSANYHWTVYSNTPSTGATGLLYLNLSDQFTVTSSRFNNTTPTSSVITLGNDGTVNESGDDHIAYCWHSVAGYSKIGSYSGGSSGSSNVIVTGFKPSFLMVKRTDQAGDAWQLFDIVRGGSDTFDNYLQANNSGSEASYSAREVNFTTNGFYWTNAESGTNISSGTYIYMAFA